VTAPALAAPSPAAVDAVAAELIEVFCHAHWDGAGDRTKGIYRGIATRLLNTAAQAEGPTP
jgi:hypothetical protein